ncbi:helix-turn-helix domain-containing protein [Ruminococcus flavefaciens]|uniref:helix-turn-helix domain-containing protein n=1 Tax=Ruminococcus flavefaciens TaxID=1265 RepID=UPI002632BAB7|nr:helix-turn-helix transcriptional regulator [Ruminococcus flavefaciens]
MNSKADLGQFISEQKQRNSLQSQELANKLGISVAYLSQLEHGKRVCPDISLLKKMIDIFELSTEETNAFYDLYEKASGQLSPDIIEYVQSSNIIKYALRTARDASATDGDWQRFIDFFKNEQ